MGRRPLGPGGAVQAAGGLVHDGDRVAIVRRPHRDDWSLPKGHLEQGESHEEAAVREVLEETGLHARIVGLAGSTAYVDGKGRPKEVRYFEMTVERGEFEPNDEVCELRWIDRAERHLLTYALDIELVERWWSVQSDAALDDQREE